MKDHSIKCANWYIDINVIILLKSYSSLGKLINETGWLGMSIS